MSMVVFFRIVPTALTAGTLYALPKVDLIASKVDRLREAWVSFKKDVRSFLGERNWMILTEVVLENLWLAHLILKYATGNAPFFTTFEKTLFELRGLFTLCACVWLFKKLYQKTLPSPPLDEVRIDDHQQQCQKNGGKCSTSLPVYENLLVHLQQGNSAPDRRALETQENFGGAVNLLNFPTIPEPLHEDAIFSQFMCPITHRPIRDPVRDPTTPPDIKVFYERGALVDWLTVHHVSPRTSQPLRLDQLIECPALKLVIDERLRYHSQKFEQCHQDYQNGLIRKSG